MRHRRVDYSTVHTVEASNVLLPDLLFAVFDFADLAWELANLSVGNSAKQLFADVETVCGSELHEPAHLRVV